MKYGIICETKCTIPLHREEIFIVNGITISLIPKNGFLNEVSTSVSIPMTDNNYTYIKKATNNMNELIVNRDEVYYKKFIDIMIHLENFLGLHYELEKITWENRKEFWTPENEIERKSNMVFSHSINGKYPIRHEKINMQLLLQMLKENAALNKLKVPLSFYREGENYFKKFRYIDSFKYLFLAMESIYANGHSKSKKMISEFKKSGNLLQGFRVSISQIDNKHKSSCMGLGVEFGIVDWENEIIEFVVRIRGFLSHHNIKSNKYGNPFEHEKYCSITLVLMTALNIELTGELILLSKVNIVEYLLNKQE